VVTFPACKGAPEVTATAILAREEHPPTGVQAIEWRLLTNRTADTLEQVVELIEWYRRRWLVEIVFTQMTKAGVFAGGADGDDVTDFDLVIGDHDPINQQFDERAFLLERGVG
jgi:hypothetical protein